MPSVARAATSVHDGALRSGVGAQGIASTARLAAAIASRIVVRGSGLLSPSRSTAPALSAATRAAMSAEADEETPSQTMATTGPVGSGSASAAR